MKKNVSTKFIILLPVFILGIVSVLSNIVAVINIKRVNNNATQIANGYMECISELGDIQKETLGHPQTGTFPYRCNRFEYHDRPGKLHPQ